jgi:hypothetical protein
VTDASRNQQPISTACRLALTATTTVAAASTATAAACAGLAKVTTVTSRLV